MHFLDFWISGVPEREITSGNLSLSEVSARSSGGYQRSGGMFQRNSGETDRRLKHHTPCVPEARCRIYSYIFRYSYIFLYIPIYCDIILYSRLCPEIPIPICSSLFLYIFRCSQLYPDTNYRLTLCFVSSYTFPDVFLHISI